MDRLENDGRQFVGLNYFIKRLIDYYQDSATPISDALTDAIDNNILTIYQISNPNDPKHPTRVCKLNQESPAVQYILKSLKK